MLHISATPYGGGVAEILRSAIPLLRDLGLWADWKLITGDEPLFSVTKAIHNGLQGAGQTLTNGEQRLPGLLGAQRRAPRGGSTSSSSMILSRCTAGAARAGIGALGVALPHRHLRAESRRVAIRPPFVAAYDAAVFTLGGFVSPDLPIECVEITPQAIDPETQEPRT